MSEKKDKLYCIIKKIGKVAFALVMVATLIVSAGSYVWATKKSVSKIERDIEKQIDKVERSTDRRVDKIEQNIAVILAMQKNHTDILKEIRRAVLR